MENIKNRSNTTTITTTIKTHDELRELEEYPREPFNSIVLRLIKEHKELKNRK